MFFQPLEVLFPKVGIFFHNPDNTQTDDRQFERYLDGKIVKVPTLGIVNPDARSCIWIHFDLKRVGFENLCF